MNIYIIKCSRITASPDPNAPVIDWLDICHDRKDKVFIMYDALRHLSRWTSVERKFPYAVRYSWRGGWGSALSHHKTLPAAIKAAKQLVKDQAP